MNEPVEHKLTKDDVIEEYIKCRDKKKVARIWGITVKEVNTILVD